MPEDRYVGSELDIFAQARNWKQYFRKHVESYVQGQVLEVGAGIGANTAVLSQGRCGVWVCLEPDRSLASRIPAFAGGIAVDVVIGTLADMAHSARFDTVLYIDVLEHIEDERAEVAAAAERLNSGGHLVVLAPAHPWLFATFDSSVGHFRRYTKESLRSLNPPGLVLRKLVYLDSVGLLASVVNRFLLRSPLPSARQIRFWDRVLVMASHVVDPVLQYRVGKSVLAVWYKSAGGPNDYVSGCCGIESGVS